MKKAVYLSCALLAYTITINALTNTESNTLAIREKSFSLIPILPSGATPILKSSLNREKEILKLISNQDKHDLFGGEPKVFPEGIMDNYGDNLEVYEGDFSNQGKNEYLFLAAAGGSMNTDTIVQVYRPEQKKLIKIDIAPIIIKNIMHGADLSKFYYWMPRPIGFVKNGKTYLRFMDYYPENKPILICTYLWESDKFTLVGPKQCLH